MVFERNKNAHMAMIIASRLCWRAVTLRQYLTGVVFHACLTFFKVVNFELGTNAVKPVETLGDLFKVAAFFSLFFLSANISAQTVTKQLYLSDPSLSLDRIDPVATADNSTSQSFELGQSAITQVGTPAFSNAAETATSHSFTYNSGVTGVNRILMVGISYRNNDSETVSAATYNGQAMTQVGTVNNGTNGRVYIYRLVNPPTGNNTLAVTWNSALNRGAVIGAITYSGVNQTNPTGTFASNTGNNTTPGVTVSSGAGQVAFGVVGGRTTSDYTATTTGATQLWTSRPFSGQTSGCGQSVPGASSVALSWSGSSNQWAAAGVSLNPNITTAIAFTQSPNLCSNLTVKAGTNISVALYLNIVNGSMPSNPNITAALRYGSTTFATSNTPTYNSGTGILTWTGTLPSDVTIPAGQAIVLDITNAQNGVAYLIEYDSQTKPSKINLPVSTYIDITSHQPYTAPYPGGSVISGPVVAGTTLYVRTVVTDPFGFGDITGLNLTITPPGSTVASTSVATSGCTRTYEYAWNTTSLGAGTYSLPATAKEGYENMVTDLQSLNINVCTPAIGLPVFALGATSTRCQGSGTVTYTATASNSTGITYSLDAASLTGGNTINAGTGQVTYLAGWTGISIITATASGCNGPTIASHTETITQTVGTPIFNLGPTSTRCLGPGSVTYTATATNSTGISYSLDATSLAGGNTINASTGAVTYTASWVGTSIITASAAGCNGPRTSTHTATTKAIIAVDDAGNGSQGAPIVLNVLSNDLCSVNSASMTIVNQPQSGSLQIGTGGEVTYLPNGSFTGNDQYAYRVCSSTSPVVCDTAIVELTIAPSVNDPCGEAVRSKTYYLPFPHNAAQLRKTLLSAANVNLLTNNARNIVSIKTAYPGTILTYDHWEDGYEADITVPIQSTTRIWGDGNPSNGIAPGYPTDIIPAGGYIILDNQFQYNPRVSSDIFFDGRDKIYTTNDIALSEITGDAGATGGTVLMNVQNLKTNVLDISRFANFFILPFGENITFGSTSAFRYTAAFIRAATNGTVVSLDYNGDGTVDLTQTLNEGEVWFYDGTASLPGVGADVNQSNDIKAGATITATNPVGVDLVFGGIDSYGTRNLALLPSGYVGNSYYNPVYTSLASAPVYVFFTNTDDSAITVNWTAGNGSSGAISVPAKGSNYINLPVATTAYKFESVGGEPFTAVAVIDADAAGSTYDWAFPLIATEQLTDFSSIAWAPGSNDLSGNYQPVWVTPTANTTLYIKFNGDLTTPTPTMSPCGIPYDIAVTLTALQAYRIFDPDNDQTGLAIFTCDGTTIAAAWGEDPNAGNPSPTGTPAMDVGYVMEPKCLQQLIVANDNKEFTQPSTPVIIAVLDNDFSFLCTIDTASISTTGLLQPSNGLITINPNGTITYLPNPGFTGTDMFEYRICSKEFTGVCDVAKVIVMVTECMPLPSESLIIGKVYVEQLPDNGAYDAGEEFAAGVRVDLYIDANCNGVLNAGESITQTTISNNSGYYSFSVQNGYNAKDDFDPTVSFSGNDGGVNWSTNWVEQSDDGVINTGDVRIMADASIGGFGNAIRIGGPSNGISRSLTFSNATAAKLKFMFRRQNFNNGGEQLLVQINGSTVYTINDGDFVPTDVNYTEVEINLTAFNANASNTLQFITNNIPATNEYFWIDNVELIYYRVPACYIAKVEPSNTGGDYSASSLNNQSASFVGLGLCDLNNYLGVLANLVAVDDAVNTPIDVPVIIPVLSNDVPGKPNPASVTTVGVTNQPANGSITINPNGTITYTPNPGFIGTDDFEYKVCSIEDPAVCDIALVTVTVSCASNPLHNTITGFVYDDVNLNGTQQAGEPGRSGVGVNLFRDLNANGVLNAGEPLVNTTTTSLLGAYAFDIVPPSTASTFLDQFNANTTANQSNGTTSWTGNAWVEVNEADGFGAGDITITSANGLRIQNANKGARRTANIAGAIAAKLIFNYVETGLDLQVGDYVDVEVASTATPSSWTLLKRYTGANGNQSGLDTFDISSFISATTTIRFISSSSATMVAGDIVYFDNVQVRYDLPTPASYIVQLVQPLPNGFSLTTPAPSPTGIHTASFAGAGAGNCQNNFGLASADLLISKTVNDENPTTGDNILFTLTVTNLGPTNATGVTVSEILPSGYTYVSDNSGGAYNSGTGQWSIGNLAASATVSIAITVTVNVTGNYTNIVTITGNQPDPDTGNNSDNLTIGPNYLPTANFNTASTNEDQAVNISVLANDTFGADGPNSGAITITDNANNGSAIVNDGGTPLDPTDDFITYTPAPNYYGADTLIYQICDSNGDCDTAVVFINILPVNDPPVANFNTATTDEDTPVTFGVVQNDTDIDGGIDPTSVTITDAPSNGTIGVNPTTGELTYTPNPGFNGLDTLVYQVCDLGMPLPAQCDTAIVFIVVNPVNDPPIAIFDRETTNEDTPVTINILANDSDSDAEIDPETVTIIDQPNHGMVSVDPMTGELTYTPNPNFHGFDTLIYQVCDDGSPLPAQCDTAIVYIVVLPMPDIAANFDQTCQDNGTPDVSTDDYFTIELTATNPDPGGSGQYKVYDGAELLATGTYGSSVTLYWRNAANTLRFLADGSTTYSLTIVDADNSYDETTLTTTPEANCSPCPPPTCPPVLVTKIPIGMD